MKLQDEAICQTSLHGLQQRLRRSNEKAEAKRIHVESVALSAQLDTV